jgi:two-component system chemotaxis sensor kinase CheA
MTASNIERDPETISLFAEESMEPIARMEQLLLEAEAGASMPSLVDVLSREFHTIKGTSGFLAFPRILGLAHAAEDLL